MDHSMDHHRCHHMIQMQQKHMISKLEAPTSPTIFSILSLTRGAHSPNADLDAPYYSLSIDASKAVYVIEVSTSAPFNPSYASTPTNNPIGIFSYFSIQTYV